MEAEHRSAGVHLTSSPIDWYTARAAGVTAYLLLTTGVLLGLTLASHRTFTRWPRFSVEDVHRFVGLLVGTFVAIHIVTIAVDSWLPFTVASLVVPFTTRYRPLWVGLGVAAAELLLALAVSNHYRRRLSYRFWRRAHYVNFAVWIAATLHGVGSGTDRSSPWLLALFAAATGAVTAGTVLRIRRHSRGLTGLAVAAVPAALAGTFVVALASGPLRFKPNPWNAPRFTEALTGHVAQLSGVTRGIVSMAGEGDGRQRVLIRADLLVSVRKLLKTSFQMEYLPSGALCDGRVTAVHRTGFAATCQLPSGEGRVVSASWQLGETSEVTAGVISARPTTLGGSPSAA
jgi:sulfoxide reductase heme-binding subunit YedZ